MTTRKVSPAAATSIAAVCVRNHIVTVVRCPYLSPISEVCSVAGGRLSNSPSRKCVDEEGRRRPRKRQREHHRAALSATDRHLSSLTTTSCQLPEVDCRCCSPASLCCSLCAAGCRLPVGVLSLCAGRLRCFDVHLVSARQPPTVHLHHAVALPPGPYRPKDKGRLAT